MLADLHNPLRDKGPALCLHCQGSQKLMAMLARHTIRHVFDHTHGCFALKPAGCRYHQQHGQQLGDGSEEDANELGLVLHISAVQQELLAKLAAWLPAPPPAQPGPSSSPGARGPEPRGRQPGSVPSGRQGQPTQSEAEAANSR